MGEESADTAGALPAEARHALNVLLMKPYLIPEQSETAWSALLTYRLQIEARLADMNLILVVDELHEVAFKRQADEDDGVPKLLRRIPLGRDASLLALWLRREWTAVDPEQNRLVVARSQIEEFFHQFQGAGDTNEKRLSDRAETAINRLKKASMLEQDRDAEHLYLASRAIIAVIGIEQVQLLRDLSNKDGGDTDPDDAVGGSEEAA